MVALDDEWACLTWDELEEDLDDYAEDAPAAAAPVKDFQGSADKLTRSGQALDCVAPSDVDALLSARTALDQTSAELQGSLTSVELQHFDAAAVMASLVHGPLCPSSPSSSSNHCSKDIQQWVQKTFGPEAGAVVPATWSPSCGSLTSAASMAEYQQQLMDLPGSFYLRRSLRLSMGEVDKYQDSKDINRDVIVINGQVISGAQGGYDAAVTALVQALEVAAVDGRGDAAAVSGAAQLILSALNRTNSGFAAFEEVLRLFSCPEFTVVSPESAAAKPLEATLIGGVVLGRAHTRYIVCGAAEVGGSQGPLATIDAYFLFRTTTEALCKLAEKRQDAGKWAVEELPALVLLLRS